MPSPTQERRFVDWSDPDTSSERYNSRYEQYCADFQHRRISQDVFRAHLYSMGFRGQDIENEVSLHWPH